MTESLANDERFLRRLCRRVLDPTLIAVPIVGLAFIQLRHHHLIADVPLWLLVCLLGGGYLLSALATALCPIGVEGWRLTVRVAVEMCIIASVTYAIGWGPTLALGLIFGLVDATRTHGSKAIRPAQITGIAVIVIGQIAIAVGIVPSLVRPPMVDAIAVLAGMGFIVTTELLRWVSQDKERIQANLAANERRFKALVRHAADVIVVFQKERLSYATPSFSKSLGYDQDELDDLNARELLGEEDLTRLADAMKRPDDVQSTEVRIRTAEGSWRWFDVRIGDLRDDPDVRGVIANLHDIDDRKHAELALAEAHERFRSAFENAPTGMAIVDLDGIIRRANTTYGEIIGRTPSELIGMTVSELLHPDDREIMGCQVRHLIMSGDEALRVEKRYLHADGHEVWVAASISCVRDETGSPLHVIGQIEDITERRALREQFAYAALHDPLTSLPNRTLFMDRLKTTLSRTTRTRKQVAVMFLDLDRFKRVNDSLGHEGGDEVLQAVASRVRSSVRPSDTVARFGGDEFAILCEDIKDENDARAFAQRIASDLNEPLTVGGSDLFVTASIGLALGDSRVEPGRLLRDADTAMYRAKERGRASVEVFDFRNDIWTATRTRTGNDLHLALQRDEFEVHYQPIVDLNVDCLVGLEALVRWRHPERGLLLPGEFIDLAEDMGLIDGIGKWVLAESCKEVVRWQSLYCTDDSPVVPLALSVNVSPRQLSDPGFADLVAEALSSSGLNPGALWLEITEATLLRDPDQAITTLRRLRGQGVHVSIDDFGTGYSSLGYLQRLPVECLKIDRTFVVDLGRHAESRAIVKAIIALADSLGLGCVAEGIETLEQLETVRELGCHRAQGFLFSRPLPAADLDLLVSEGLHAWNDRSEELTG
ncbi:MAG TPA: EAL domain-containing protein [Acidimicrobiales bacterium]|nr:EAL domain-containing protein [Acidimicrobiales bacterium]